MFNLAESVKLDASGPFTNNRRDEINFILGACRLTAFEQRADVVVTAVLPADTIGELLLTIDFVAVACPDHPLFELDRPLTTDDLIRHVQVVVREARLKIC